MIHRRRKTPLSIIDWLANLAGEHKGKANRAWRLTLYLWLNVWTVLPGMVAIAVLILLRQSTFLVEACLPDPPQAAAGLTTNPIFCPSAGLIRTTLADQLENIKNALTPQALSHSAQTAARQTNNLAEQAKQQKEIADAEVKRANAAIVAAAKSAQDSSPASPAKALPSGPHQPNHPATPPAPSAGSPQQQMVAQQKYQKAQADLASAKAELARISASELAKSQFRAHAALFREARARLRWIASYAAILVFAFGTILASLWSIVSAIDDHLFPEPILPDTRSPIGPALAGLSLLTAASAVFFFLEWYLCYAASRTFLFRDLPPDSPFDSRLLRFQDAITGFIFGNDAHQTGSLLPLAEPLIGRTNFILLIALIALAGAISSTLYQRPVQILHLDDPATDAQIAAALGKTPPASLPQQAYDRLLIRSFQRLNSCVYVGATLLVICVISVSARYGWIAAVLDPDSTDEPWKSTLPSAINGLAEELAVQYGLGFTTLLVGLLIPTWVILRRRAWVVARLRNPGSDDVKSLQDWLSANGMGFTSVQKYAQVLAVLAPAGAGVFVAALKALAGASN